MPNPKLRWTLEEENALRAGVDKYGIGKWRNILSDEDFAPCLIARSNVDLKDKWRNLCSNASSSKTAPPQRSTDKEIGPRYNSTIQASFQQQNVIGEVKVEEGVVQVLREVGYEEHEINVAVEDVKVPSMDIEDSKDAQELISKPKLLLKSVFKALKKLAMGLKGSKCA